MAGPRVRAVAALALVALLAAACGGGGDDSEVAGRDESTTIERSTTTAEPDDSTTTTTELDTTPPTPDANAGVRGDLELGRSVRVHNGTASVDGGRITVPSGTIEGFAIDVPSGAFAVKTPFSVTITEITDSSYGEWLRPITPLITVDNGGGYSAEIMTVTVPAHVPESWFAMAFLRADDGSLEALPPLDLARDHVTFATRHFSSFFVGAIEYALLPEDVGTGYRVQDDNWPFVNRGTYPRPNGICTGMSLSSIWYFLERKDDEGELWSRWDDDGRQDTPQFWFDDAFALRWATKLQTQMEWSSKLRQLAYRHNDLERLQYDAFRFAMFVTGEPQLLEMWDANGGNGHAMVVYAQTPGSLWIADPNYPKDLRSIRFDDATGDLLTYSSGTNAEAIESGVDVAYEQFILTAKSGIYDWPSISGLYEQMKAGIVGAGVFPPYDLVVRVKLPDGRDFVEPLRSGYLTSQATLDIGVSPTFDAMVYLFKGTSPTATKAFEANGSQAFASFPLLVGDNEIGIGIMAGPNDANPQKWIDFRRITIYRSDTTTTLPPPTVPPPTEPPPTVPPSPPTTEDCSQYPRGSIRWVECTVRSGGPIFE